MATINGLDDLFSVVFAASKDSAYKETSLKMQEAYHKLILADADARRYKTEAIIQTMAKIDREVILFKREYNRIEGQLTPEAQKTIESYLKIIEQKKNDIKHEKQAMKKGR